MTDQQLLDALRRLDVNATPDPAFEEALRRRVYSIAAGGTRTPAPRLQWFVAAAAAVAIVALIATFAIGPLRGPGVSRPDAVPSASAAPSSHSPALSNLDASLVFDRPFRFRLPAGVHLAVNKDYLPLLLELVDGPVVGGQYGSDGNGSPPGLRGIEVASLRGDVSTHPCPIPSNHASRFPVSGRQPGFLEDLARVGGMTFTPPTTTTVDSRPAISTRLTDAACGSGDFHVTTGGYVDLTVPSRLVLVDIDGVTVAIQVWATTEEELSAWLPIAQTVIDSLDFVEP